jgi:hypothetical protein
MEGEVIAREIDSDFVGDADSRRCISVSDDEDGRASLSRQEQQPPIVIEFLCRCYQSLSLHLAKKGMQMRPRRTDLSDNTVLKIVQSLETDQSLGTKKVYYSNRSIVFGKTDFRCFPIAWPR